MTLWFAFKLFGILIEIENPRTKDIPGMYWIKTEDSPTGLDDRINLFVNCTLCTRCTIIPSAPSPKHDFEFPGFTNPPKQNFIFSRFIFPLTLQPYSAFGVQSQIDNENVIPKAIFFYETEGGDTD